MGYDEIEELKKEVDGLEQDLTKCETRVEELEKENEFLNDKLADAKDQIERIREIINE